MVIGRQLAVVAGRSKAFDRKAEAWLATRCKREVTNVRLQPFILPKRKKNETFVFYLWFPSFQNFLNEMQSISSFLALKKNRTKIQFDVHITIESLTDVPLVQGLLFTKWRLWNAFNDQKGSTQRSFFGKTICLWVIGVCSLNVKEHGVTWDCSFDMKVTLIMDLKEGALMPCYLNLDVRKVNLVWSWIALNVVGCSSDWLMHDLLLCSYILMLNGAIGNIGRETVREYRCGSSGSGWVRSKSLLRSTIPFTTVQDEFLTQGLSLNEESDVKHRLMKDCNHDETSATGCSAN